ncbi:MAG: endonuclease I family protein [Silvanigrellaceae bacterium]
MHPHQMFPWSWRIASALVALPLAMLFSAPDALANPPQNPADCKSSDQSCIRETLRTYAQSEKKTLTYSGAREAMFQKVDVYLDEKGTRVVKSCYSPEIFEVGHSIPKNGVNTEHTWPQTFLKRSGRFEEARADIYHLFPSEIQINGLRGSLPFRECGHESNVEGAICENSSRGFEPPEDHKGVVARAMFYISVLYSLPIDQGQEKTLREWASSHPVSNTEVQRADKIQSVQGNRNPFIDHPEWIDIVSDF